MKEEPSTSSVVARSELSPASFTMPDGRAFHLYGPFSGTPHWDFAGAGHEVAFSHRRWHPVRREWVVYSAHRQTRTYKPTTNLPVLSPIARRRNPAAGFFDRRVRQPLFLLPEAMRQSRRRSRDWICRSPARRETAKLSSIPPTTAPRWPRCARNAANFSSRVGRPRAGADADAGRASGDAVREPRRRSRRHAASSARTDLRLLLSAADHRDHGAELPRRLRLGEADVDCRIRSCADRDHGGASCRRLPASPMKSGSRPSTSGLRPRI